MKTFNKPAKTFAEQVELLKARGMQFSNEQDAQFYLEQINYYRLGAYWLPFEQTHSPHCFKAETTFEQVLELYIFDRELRLLILDAIERFEVAVRTRFAYELAHRHGCHAYLQGHYFKPFFRWQNLLESLKKEVSRADEVFVEHYKRNYDEPELPPIWATCEVMSFGQLSMWYQLLAPIQTRKAISSHFDCDEKQFEGLLQHFVYLRNTCAHHARLGLLAAGLLASTHYSKKLTESKEYQAKIETEVENIQKLWVLLDGIAKRSNELHEVTYQLEDTIIRQLDLLDPLSVDYNTNDDYYTSTFQKVAILIKSMSELAQTPLLDENGNTSAESTRIIENTYSVLNTELAHV